MMTLQLLVDFNIHGKAVQNQSLEKLDTFCKTFGPSDLVNEYTY